MNGAFVIFPGAAPQRWSVATLVDEVFRQVCIDTMTGFDGPFAPVRNALEQLKYHGQGLLLALPSSLCLCAVVDDQGLRKSSRRSGLLFRLEEQLPLAMEEIEADFVAGTGHVLGVAVCVQSVAPLIESLEAEGIAIARICPAALLVGEEAVRQLQTPSHLDVLLISQNTHVDLIAMTDGRVSGWALLPQSNSSVDLHLLRHCLENADRLRVGLIGCSSELQARLAGNSRFELVEIAQTDPAELAARAAKTILAGDTKAPVELRVGKLASGDPLRFIYGPLRAAAFATSVLLLTLAIAMFWLAHRYESLAGMEEARQLEAFRQALPEQTPPTLIASRMLSEEKRLEGISGSTGELPPFPSVLPLFRDVLKGLPSQIRFHLVELRFEPSRFYLEGQSLDHGSADQIAESLRQSTGLQVDPPHTEQPSGEDVVFDISSAESSSGSELAGTNR